MDELQKGFWGGHNWRKRLMRNVWDIKRGYMKGMITTPKKLKSTGVKRLVEDALWTQSVRKKLEDGKKRHDFQSNHGFRKWFKTQCELAGIKVYKYRNIDGPFYWNFKFIL